MAGIRSLRKVQIGLESSSGTAVAATAIYRGQAAIDDQSNPVFPVEDVGYLSGTDRAYIPKKVVNVTFTSHEATFEQLPYHLAAGIKNVVDGVANGGTSNGYVYAYPLATTAQPTVKSYTIEAGDNNQAEEVEYAQCRSFSLSGAPGEAIMLTADWYGRQRTKTTFTSLSLTAVEEILFQNTKLYIDAVSGTAGATQATNTMLGFELNVTTGMTPVWTGDGQLYFSFSKTVQPEVLLTVTFEHDAVGVARRDDFAAGTARLVRLLTTGTALTGSGGTYTTKALQIDMAAKIDSIETIDEIDGNDIVRVTFRARYSTTSSSFATITVCNTLAALV